MGKDKQSKCTIKIPFISSLKKGETTDYIDKNLIDIVRGRMIDSTRIRINWENEMFNDMLLEDCWNYAYELMNYIFYFRTSITNFFMRCSFTTYAGRGNNTLGINYGMPIIHVLMIHNDINIIGKLMNFIKQNPRFYPVYNYPVVIRDPYLMFKYIFNGNGNSYIVKMVPTNYTLYWYSSIEELRLFMNVITGSKNRRIKEIND